ncbi:MAG: tyrosine-type recombinase/integrase [Candidatus Limnocylindria bacterium]
MSHQPSSAAGSPTATPARRGTRYRLEPPKTAKGRRTIPLPDVLVATALREHRVRQVAERLAAGAAWQDWDLVFCTTIGTRSTPGTSPVPSRTCSSGRALPKIRFHDLRHSAATFIVVQGVDPRTIMETLEHSQIAITMNTYTRVLPVMQRDAADRMDAVLSVGAVPGS